ncbi:helix-hairpin-helix domain-containing protein [candidate division KSB1 bacterium]|nr:helix-hairpin-helix domain-containing protein [candidate division KSB1 bacterium]
MKNTPPKPALFICIYFFIFMISQTWGQEFFEELFENEVESEDNSVILEHLLYLQEHPMDLNKVGSDELQTIPWITPLSANAIINYRAQQKGFTKVEELNGIKEIQPNYNIIKDFFTVQKEQKKGFSISGRHRLLLRTQKSRGYKEGIYEGDRSKIYNRVQGSVTDNFRFGLLTEKDPGEKHYNDLATGYGQIYLSRFKSTIYLGNYLVESGQGLVFWGPYQLNRGSNPVAVVKKRARGLLPYTSVDENVSFTGAGIKTALGNIECGGFYSLSSLDANVEDDSIRSLQNTGYHRYGNEIKNKDRIKEKVLGGYMNWQKANFYLGTQWQTDLFGKQFAGQTSGQPLNGTGNVVGSVDFGLTTGEIHFFGEVAKSRYSAFNYIQGILWNLDDIDLILSLRKYHNNFVNFHGKGFGENEDLTNEEAVYFGWKWRVQPSTTTAFYFDLYRHPVYNQEFIKPVNGWELMGNVEHRFLKELTVFLRLRIRNAQLYQNTFDSYGNRIKKVFNRQKTSIRAQIDYRVKDKLGFRTRLEYNWLTWNNYNIKSSLIDSSGVLFYNDIFYNLKSFSVRLRLTLFDAPLSDLSFYLFENDLPGVLRLKMLNHRGSRIYLLSAYRWKKHFKTTVKYEYTFYDNMNSIGSGYDLINSDHDNMLSLQFDWSL